DGSDREDASPLLLLHVRDDLLRKVHDAHEVRIDGAFPLFGRGGEKAFGRWASSVGNADVGAAKFLNYRIDEITDRGSIGDIKWFSKDFGLVLLANVFSGAVERFAVAGAHSDLAAFGGEGVGSCTTNSLARRSYDGDSIFEPSFHVVR